MSWVQTEEAWKCHFQQYRVTPWWADPVYGPTYEEILKSNSNPYAGYGYGDSEDGDKSTQSEEVIFTKEDFKKLQDYFRNSCSDIYYVIDDSCHDIP